MLRHPDASDDEAPGSFVSTWHGIERDTENRFLPAAPAREHGDESKQRECCVVSGSDRLS